MTFFFAKILNLAIGFSFFSSISFNLFFSANAASSLAFFKASAAAATAAASSAFFFFSISSFLNFSSSSFFFSYSWILSDYFSSSSMIFGRGGIAGSIRTLGYCTCVMTLEGINIEGIRLAGGGI